jgi:hypothetical protein
LLPHPLAETHEQRRKRFEVIVTMTRNEIRIREVTQEKTQLVSEARNEWPGRSDSKIANSPGRLEELGKHDVLLSWGRHDNAEPSAHRMRDQPRDAAFSSA